MTGKRRTLHTPLVPRGDQKAELPFDGDIWHDDDALHLEWASARPGPQAGPSTKEIR